jgi:hypothetical protein
MAIGLIPARHQAPPLLRDATTALAVTGHLLVPLLSISQAGAGYGLLAGIIKQATL